MKNTSFKYHAIVSSKNMVYFILCLLPEFDSADTEVEPTTMINSNVYGINVIISVTWFSLKYYLPRMAAIDRIISFKRESCFSTEKRLQLYFAVMAMITMMFYIQSKVTYN